MFWKDRAIQLKFVKPERGDTSLFGDKPSITYDPGYLAEIATNVVTHTALVIGGVCITYKLVDTACKIAVITAKAVAR